MKKLGLGLMRLPLIEENNSSKIDIEATKVMVDEFLDNGFNYFDTAWMYHSYESENAVKEVLTKRHKRDEFLLATKLHANYVKSLDDRDRIFSEQKEKTGVSYFDYYLLHDVREAHLAIYEKYDCFNWLIEKKKAGEVKNIGFSFHDNAEFLDKVLTKYPFVDFVQLQLNYLDWDNESIQSRLCYEVAEKHGKKVIVMEPVKGGTLAKLPEEAEAVLKNHNPEVSVPSWAIRFVALLPNVFMVLSGMSNLEQLRDNIKTMDNLTPLTKEENRLIKEVVAIINKGAAIPCTGCSYCTDGCPQKIAIPKYFELYNAEMQEAEGKGWSPQIAYYENMIKTFGKASDCIGCGACEEVCPQNLPITRYLKSIVKSFEEVEN
ncbi:MAG: aldo/keto reductase [Clostridia bacterium]|nr:aldo/keto reductase [Clostridia bacterium]